MEEALAEARRAVDIVKFRSELLWYLRKEKSGAEFNRRQIDMDPTGHAELIDARTAKASEIGGWKVAQFTSHWNLARCVPEPWF